MQNPDTGAGSVLGASASIGIASNDDGAGGGPGDRGGVASGADGDDGEDGGERAGERRAAAGGGGGAASAGRSEQTWTGAESAGVGGRERICPGWRNRSGHSGVDCAPAGGDGRSESRPSETVVESVSSEAGRGSAKASIGGETYRGLQKAGSDDRFLCG
jgi:hypothetical protein